MFVLPRYFETRSKRVSLKLAVMRANVGALIAWLRASIINGWLGNQPFNPELRTANRKFHERRRQNHINWIVQRTQRRRLRLGRIGGRYPPRKPGSPTKRDQPTT